MVRPFGAETLDEKHAIRERLIATGMVAGSSELYFAIEREFEAAHAADPWFRETQAWRAMDAAMRAPRRPRSYLTPEELDYVLERLAGVNDPLGIRARDVLATMRANARK